MLTPTLSQLLDDIRDQHLAATADTIAIAFAQAMGR